VGQKELYLSIDNLVTVHGRKLRDMSEVFGIFFVYQCSKIVQFLAQPVLAHIAL